MKALSIKQPWASLIASGIKDIENRTWATKYRGRIYIHASSKLAFDSMANQLTTDQLDAVAKHNLESYPKNIILSAVKYCLTSAIIGEVDIVDCVLGHDSIWAEHSATDLRKGIEVEVPVYNWVLANPVLYNQRILNVKGALSLWEYDKPYQVVGSAEMVNF
ncbi:ASCH domain-containing protein [Pedobacter sp. AW1-32]|uniref:ASCH domain-containing protein n=1 Tax=Pedobacter sp. AW1-32 TaxID=3383026 RepID=UPI003FEDC93C